MGFVEARIIFENQESLPSVQPLTQINIYLTVRSMKQKTQNKINKQQCQHFTTIWSEKLNKHVILASKESKSTIKAGISAKRNLMLNVTSMGGGAWAI